MKTLSLLFLCFTACVLTCCAYSVHQVHVSDFEPPVALESGRLVQATAEQFVVLNFTTQTDYINEAYYKLQKACLDGTITGITTQHSTSLGFFSWTNKILMQGLCTKQL